MANPDLDMINSKTLEALRDDVTLDNLFHHSKLMDSLDPKYTYFRRLQGWKLTTAQRMYAQNVNFTRIFEVLNEMDKSGQYPECPYLEDSGVGTWDGNTYATYGSISRNVGMSKKE